ncbi:NifB/NifX family molybdenum-iron cluster-binding protein [Oceanobacter mangrovi]|uniref:NifB/NifX family molybdenum-iron cluster-binding protein n=1 Tax=Oceanobacter mangrovi TaxID=2862510 RepID=UPI001C8D7218|nr:hypothetical protein [Oceanobacter mangrovi]
MSESLIAVAVQADGTISPHGGRADHWDVYVIGSQGPELVWSLDLQAAGSLHEWHVRGDGNRHPLHAVDVAICGSAGEGVTRRLGERGTLLETTTESQPLKAIEDYLASQLAPGLPHEEAACLHPEHRREASEA